MVIVGMAVSDVVDIRRRFRGEEAHDALVCHSEEYLLGVLCKGLPGLERVDHDTGVNQRPHI